MNRETAFTPLTVLALLVLAIAGCTTAKTNTTGGDQLASTSVQPAVHGDPEVAQSADQHGAGGGGHSEASVHGDDLRAHGGGRGHGGPGGEHGSGAGRHGPGDQRQERAGRRVGEEVGDFALTDSTGSVLRLSTLRGSGESEGKIAVLTFWCTTCHSCRGIEKDFDVKAREYDERGVLFLMVDSNVTDDAERVNRFLEKKQLGFRVLMDSRSEVARYFGAKLTTTTAVIDAEGRLRYYGGFGGAEAAVQDLLAGDEVAVPESPGGG